MLKHSGHQNCTNIIVTMMICDLGCGSMCFLDILRMVLQKNKNVSVHSDLTATF